MKVGLITGLFLLLLVGLLVRNPAGSVALTATGGTELNSIFGTLGGAGGTPQKGSVSVGNVKSSFG